MSPIKKKKLNKLRNELDSLDNTLLKIIKKRTAIVKQVLKLKDYKYQIVDKKRIKIILNRIKKKSIKSFDIKKITPFNFNYPSYIGQKFIIFFAIRLQMTFN